MDDERIIELFFARSEQAIGELDIKYGKLCHNLSHNILGNRRRMCERRLSWRMERNPPSEAQPLAGLYL